MRKTKLKTKNHTAFKLHYHIVFVTKYRKKVLNKEILHRFNEISKNTLVKWECELNEFGGEEDHCHLLIEAHPSMNLTVMISNLKSVSARLIRKEYSSYLYKVYWKPYFWSRSYAVLTTGGANMETVKQYVTSQGQSN